MQYAKKKHGGHNKIDDGLTNRQRYVRRKRERGICYHSGCWEKARKGGRYCENHRTRKSRGFK